MCDLKYILMHHELVISVTLKDKDSMDEERMSMGKDNDSWLNMMSSSSQEEGILSRSSSPFTATATTQPKDNSWTALINQYDLLLSTKVDTDRRTFNKSVANLLDKTMVVVRHHVQEQQKESASVLSWRHAEMAFAKYRKELLNQKEIKSEELIEQIVAYAGMGLQSSLTADERKVELEKKSLALLQDLSPQMSIKLAPVVKSYIARQFGCALDDMLAEVFLPEPTVIEKTQMYTRMINNFLDDVSCLSFALSNKRLLGNIAPVDMWFLTFFAFVTVKRCRGDQMLMLGCVGEPFSIYIIYITIVL